MLLTFLLCVLILYVPVPVHGGPLWPVSVAGVLALAVVNVVAGWAASSLAIQLTSSTGMRGRLAATRLFALLKGGVVGFVLADVFLFDWPAVVMRWLGKYRWALLAEDIMLLLPAVVMVLTVMAWQYRYESQLGRVGIRPGRYLWLRFRLELAIVVLPWLLLVLFTDLSAAVFAGTDYAPLADGLATGGVLVGLVVFSPALLRWIWRSSPLPDGPLRRRLHELMREQDFRCHDILIWHTDDHLANAGVIGPTPLLRYIIISDVLLSQSTPQEVVAIFAHEIGHVKLKHLPYYMALALGFICMFANLVDGLAAVGLVEPLQNILALDMTLAQAGVMLSFAAVYWVLFFGWVSRRMELESDLFALGAVEDPTALLAALEKLGMLSSSPRSSGHWRHFSISRRVGFLTRVLENPKVGHRFRGYARRIKWASLLVCAAAALRIALFRPELLGL